MRGASRWLPAGLRTLALVVAIEQASAATFVVTSTTDNAVDPGLRRAINDANANPGPDVIVFQFASYPVTLGLNAALPPITEGVVIDATEGGPCQAGAPPRVQFDGAGLGPTNGLTIDTPEPVTVKGLAIYRFGGAGIRLVNNMDSVIAGNYLGLDIQGLVPNPGNGSGLVLESCTHVTIGGTNECERNVISGNQRGGIEVYNGADARILGNFIGTQPSGMAAMPNQYGVGLFGAVHCQVGSTAAGEANVISGNQLWGVQILGPLGVPQVNTIEGNFIGTGPGGSPPLPNGADGVYFFGGPTGNLVRRNVIRFNGGNGVLVLEGIDNTIVENAIADNVRLGIDISPAFAVNPNDGFDLDEGPNRQQNYPEIYMCSAFPPTSGPKGTTVRAQLHSEPFTTFAIHYYWSPNCDPSGYGEGRHYLGTTNVTTDAFGNAGTFTAGFPEVIPVGTYITMTATHPAGSSSEFSLCSCPVVGASGVIHHAGLPHEPIGGAALTPRPDGTLQVSGSAAGSEGPFGVHIGLGRAQGWVGQFDRLRMEPGQTLAMEVSVPETPNGPETVEVVKVVVIQQPAPEPPLVEISTALYTNRGPFQVREIDPNGHRLGSGNVPAGGRYPLPICSSNGALGVAAVGVVRLSSGARAMMMQFIDDGYGPA
ncbi:MAG TPA: right-handed parallel beta-helix repeat-containing protein, partial [Methylomirabilota bacterium]|nr:right-handed parallel beta-helix repeat-containing protein [Methylomirabilota bacterium]